MPDRSEGEPPEGGAVDDGWSELLQDGDPAPAPSRAEPRTGADETAERQENATGAGDEPGKEADKEEDPGADSPTRERPPEQRPPDVEAAETEAASPEGGPSWGFVGALVVAAVLVGAWVMSTQDDAPTPAASQGVRTPEVGGGERDAVDRADRRVRADHAIDEKAVTVETIAQDTQPASVEPPGAKPPAEAEEPGIDPKAAETRPDPVQPVPSSGGGNPRAVPPGTPPEVAKVFEGLPVTPTDGPPVGKIGKSGFHVDRISVGTVYKRGECGGQPDDFSISKRQRANVCFRVVHDRYQAEQLRVLWQKDGGTVRRTKLSVPAAHAYRTRAFMVLREEYVGRWTVRIMSADGIELATHAFSVVK